MKKSALLLLGFISIGTGCGTSDPMSKNDGAAKSGTGDSGSSVRRNENLDASGRLDAQNNQEVQASSDGREGGQALDAQASDNRVSDTPATIPDSGAVADMRTSLPIDAPVSQPPDAPPRSDAASPPWLILNDQPGSPSWSCKQTTVDYLSSKLARLCEDLPDGSTCMGNIPWVLSDDPTMVRPGFAVKTGRCWQGRCCPGCWDGNLCRLSLAYGGIDGPGLAVTKTIHKFTVPVITGGGDWKYVCGSGGEACKSAIGDAAGLTFCQAFQGFHYELCR